MPTYINYLNLIKTVNTALSKCADIDGEFPTITNLNEEKRFVKKLLKAGLVRRISKKSNIKTFFRISEN